MIPGACWHTEEGDIHSHAKGIGQFNAHMKQSYQQSSYISVSEGKEGMVWKTRCRWACALRREMVIKKGKHRHSESGELLLLLHFQLTKAEPKPTTNSKQNEVVNQWTAVFEHCWTGCFQGEIHTAVNHTEGRQGVYVCVRVCVCVFSFCPLCPVGNRASNDHHKLG